MKRSQAPSRARRGFSLLEMITAAAITATLMASSMVVIRSSYAAWQAHEGDLEPAVSADAVLRHIIRNIRQAQSVVDVTDASDATGRIELRNSSGGNDYWEHTGSAAGEIVFNSSGGLLARGIDELSFAAFQADGVTPATTPSEAQAILCTVKVTLPRGAGETRTVSCCGWVRSW